MRVLLIDDHALVRKGIEELLQSRGVQVVASVGSGEEGVQRARELSTDLVLLDVKMPGMNGIETLKQIREGGARWDAFWAKVDGDWTGGIKKLRDLFEGLA